MYGFTIWCADVNYLDYGGTWYRRSKAPLRFYFIRSINWVDAVGEREAAEVGKTYNLELTEVDLASIEPETLRQALSFTGQEAPLKIDDSAVLLIAAACHDYGAHAPLDSVNTDNFHVTFRQLAAEARRLDTDDAAHDEAMEKPVNKLGSTAREYMRGDLTSAFNRMSNNDPVKGILAKLRGLPTLGGGKFLE